MKIKPNGIGIPVYAIIVFFLAIFFLCFLSIPLSDSSVEIDGEEVPCIGAGEDKDNRYIYKIDAGNVIFSIVSAPAFFIPSAYIVFNRIQCPTGKKIVEDKNVK